MRGAIEINDSGICVVADGQLRLESPGYALLTPHGVELGHAARQRASLEPHAVHHRFWRDLGTDALPRPVPGARTIADLASLHLAHVWEQAGDGLDPIILVVSDSFSTAQLGLLLGIAGNLGLPVAGLVHTALAASHTPHPGRRLLHLDLQLHAAALTVLDQGPRLRTASSHLAQGAGWLAFEERCLAVIAARFVAGTRFDPRHRARGEQDLRDRLPGWLEALAESELITIEMQAADGRVHAIELARQTLCDAVLDLNRQVVGLIASHRGSGPAVVQVSHRLGKLIGLPRELSAVPDLEVIPLAAAAAGVGALQRAPHITAGPANTLTRSLPWLRTVHLVPPTTPPPRKRDKARRDGAKPSSRHET